MCHEHISESVKLDVSKDAAATEETAISASKDLLQATEEEYVLSLEDVDELQPEHYEQLSVEDVPSAETHAATVAEATDVVDLTIRKSTSPELAEVESSISLPKEEEKPALLQPLVVEESNPEESIESQISEPAAEEMQPSEVIYEEIISKDSVAVEAVKTEESAVGLSIPAPTSPETAEAESAISLPKEEEKIELLKPLVAEESYPQDSIEPLVSEAATEEIHPSEVIYDEMVSEACVVLEMVKTEEAIADLSIPAPTSPEIAEAESSISLPKEEEQIELLQPLFAEETHGEDFVEPLAIEVSTEELHQSDVVYEDILSKESVTMQMVETEECEADLSLQKSASPEVAEVESSISLPQEQEKIELLQPLEVEETYPEDSIESLIGEPTTEEMHPTEVVYEEILSNESVAVEAVKTEESVVDLSILAPTSPEIAEAESSISLPKEEEQIELLQSLVTEESNPEDCVEPLVSDVSTEEVKCTEVVYDEIISKEKIAVETVEPQQCAADLSIEKRASPEVAEAESSISRPREEEPAATVEFELAKPEVSATSDATESTAVEETAAADVQKTTELERVEIEAPKSEVTEDVSLTVAKEPTPEDVSVDESLKIPSDASKKPEPEAKEEESASLTVRREPQEEDESDATLSLRQHEDGTMPVGRLLRGRWMDQFAYSSLGCFQLSTTPRGRLIVAVVGSRPRGCLSVSLLDVVSVLLFVLRFVYRSARRPTGRPWRFGVAVTRWSRSTQLLYIEPG